MYEQAVIAVIDVEGYGKLHALINTAFAEREIESFLDRVCRSGRHVRDFEGVVARGLLGKEAQALYGNLAVSDQGLTRERYLQLVESVRHELRQRYSKAYTSF